MPGAVVAFTFEGKKKIVSINESTSFEDVVRTCCNTWRTLTAHNILMSYSIEDISDCILQSDDDIEGMLALYKAVTAKLIKVDVKKMNIEKGALVGEEETTLLMLPSTSCGASSSASESQIAFTGSQQEIIGDVSSITSEKVLLSAGWEHLIHSVGQRFRGGAPGFRIELLKYAMAIGFKYKMEKNNTKKIFVVCSKKKSAGCKWFCIAKESTSNAWFFIDELHNVHTCCPSPLFNKTDLLTVKMMANLILDEVRQKPQMTAIDAKAFILKHYGLTVDYMIAWRGLEKVRDMLFGKYEESFDELKWYIEALMQTNPGSYTRLETDSENRFKRLFVAFAQSIEGFNHCRPLLFTDGTNLKSRSGGVLLAAIGKDAENGLYPLAFAIVDSENDENWEWFLSHVNNILDPIRNLVVISDRHHGLLHAVPKVFNGKATHFYCLEHLKRNLREKYCGKNPMSLARDKFVNRFAEAAQVTTHGSFNEKVAELIAHGGPIMKNFVESLDITKWNNAYSPRGRYGEMYSNPAESFNSWVKEAKSLPLLHLMETIRIGMMKWFNNRYTTSLKWNTYLCPLKNKVLAKNIEDSSVWPTACSMGDKYNILCEPSVTVDLDKQMCTCSVWQVFGFPCVHACAAIKRSNKKIEDVVERYFTVESYRNCYANGINPIPSMMRQHVMQQLESSSIDDDILPPQTKRPPGRPRTNRIKSRGEKKRVITCGRCKTIGHNSKNCKEPIG